MMYLVDTDYLVDALANVPSALTLLPILHPEGIGVSIISVGELYDGAFGTPDSVVELATLRRFLSVFDIVDLTDEIMEAFGRTRALLRRQGLLIPDLDLLIAATAISYNLTLLSRNRRHFQRVPDLKLYQPT